MNHSPLGLNEGHGSSNCLKVRMSMSKAVNDCKVLIGYRVVRWSMNNGLLNNVHTHDGTWIGGIPESDSYWNVLIGHWNGEGMSDNGLHGKRCSR